MRGYVAEEQLKVSVFNDTLDMAIAQVAQVTRRFTGMNGHGKQIWVAAPALRSNSDRDVTRTKAASALVPTHLTLFKWSNVYFSSAWLICPFCLINLLG